MLTAHRRARQAIEFPDLAPPVVLLVEMSPKVGGISVTHDAADYERAYERLVKAFGTAIRSPDENSKAAVSVMVAQAPPADRHMTLGCPPVSGGVLGDRTLPSTFSSSAVESRIGAFEVWRDRV